jgi:biopolymer transport protein ExbB/TolQ
MSSTQILVIAILTGIVLYFIFGRKNSSLPQTENDAKRFARLLIAELKLNENYKIERGLKNNNLNESLKDEIAEARKKYKTRISNADLERFFDEAVIEILANSDKSKFGIVSTSLDK